MGHADGEAGQGGGSLRTGLKVPGALSWPQSRAPTQGSTHRWHGHHQPCTNTPPPGLPRNTEPSGHSLVAKGLVRDPKSPYPPGQVSRPWESTQSFLPTLTWSDHSLGYRGGTISTDSTLVPLPQGMSLRCNPLLQQSAQTQGWSRQHPWREGPQLSLSDCV